MLELVVEVWHTMYEVCFGGFGNLELLDGVWYAGMFNLCISLLACMCVAICLENLARERAGCLIGMEPNLRSLATILLIFLLTINTNKQSFHSTFVRLVWYVVKVYTSTHSCIVFFYI